jgi:hypothetical protein
VGASDETADIEDGASDVRLSEVVVDALRHLPPHAASAVAGAIRRIGDGNGVMLRITTPSAPGIPYFAMVPANADAPVAIYRKLRPHEDGEYLVTAIINRENFDTYRCAEQQGLLDSVEFEHSIIDAANGAFGWISCWVPPTRRRSI